MSQIFATSISPTQTLGAMHRKDPVLDGGNGFLFGGMPCDSVCQNVRCEHQLSIRVCHKQISWPRQQVSAAGEPQRVALRTSLDELVSRASAKAAASKPVNGT